MTRVLKPKAPSSASFMAEIAHELRSPLGGLQALSDLLGETNLTDEQRRMVLGLQAAAKHLRAVASALIDDDRLSADAPAQDPFAMDEAPFDLSVVLADLALAADARALVKKLRFTLECSESVPRNLMGDARRIRQMLENLIDNAVKVTKEGSVALLVEHVDTRNGFIGLRFTVSDTGPGFSEDQKDVLFKAFSRLSDDRNGTGLGLSLVKRFSGLMGGEVGCDGKPGEGARFWFTLRLKSADCPAAGVCPSGAASGAAHPIRHQHPILVVDDNATNRLILRAILEHFDYACIEAASGEEALDILAREPVAAVMLDQTLPGLSGVETLKRIRASQAPHAHVRVIPVSGRVSAADRAAFAEAGADGFIEKPVSARAIMEALQMVEPHAQEPNRSAA